MGWRIVSVRIGRVVFTNRAERIHPPVFSLDHGTIGNAWVKDVENRILEILLDVTGAMFRDEFLEQCIPAGVVTAHIFFPSGERAL